MDSAAKKRILVVDDEPQVGAAMRRLLSRQGFEVSVVGSGEAALEQWEGLRPDLVLTDYRMTGMDGVALLGEVARRTQGIPGVLVSGNIDPDLVAELDADRFSFVPKPWDDGELVATLRRLLDVKRERGAG